MKYRKLDLDSQKYKELLARIESRKKLKNQNPNNALNYKEENANHNDHQAKGRYYISDDFAVKDSSNRVNTNKLMPNSAKNQRRNQDQMVNLHQQYFKKSRDPQTKSDHLKYPQNQYVSRDSPKQSKNRKQYSHFQKPQQLEGGSSNCDYQKLHQKLDFIENKISEMKSNLQKKKQEKRKLLQMQEKQKNKKQAQKIFEQSKKKGGNPLNGLVTQTHQHAGLHAFQKNPYSPKHNIYYVSEIIRTYKDNSSIAKQHLCTSLQIFRILQNAKVPSNDEMKQRRVNLLRKKGYQNKKTIVFDLDQTLIHCNQTLNVPYDLKLTIQQNENRKIILFPKQLKQMKKLEKQLTHQLKLREQLNFQ